MNSQELNTVINNYQNQKAACEQDLQKVSIDIGIAEKNLAQMSQQAITLFGTDNIDQLSTQLQTIITEQQSLEEELNLLNQNN